MLQITNTIFTRCGRSQTLKRLYFTENCWVLCGRRLLPKERSDGHKIGNGMILCVQDGAVTVFFCCYTKGRPRSISSFNKCPGYAVLSSGLRTYITSANRSKTYRWATDAITVTFCTIAAFSPSSRPISRVFCFNSYEFEYILLLLVCKCCGYRRNKFRFPPILLSSTF